jgi:hypothetical protein
MTRVQRADCRGAVPRARADVRRADLVRSRAALPLRERDWRCRVEFHMSVTHISPCCCLPNRIFPQGSCIGPVVIDLTRGRRYSPATADGRLARLGAHLGLHGDNRCMPVTRTPAEIPASQVLQARYRSRLPRSLDDLAGPASGTVQLPLHVAWSGLTAFDLDKPKPRMSLYRVVLAEGQCDDLVNYLNGELLVGQWPVLRTLVSRHIRGVWEDAFPELASRHPGEA